MCGVRDGSWGEDQVRGCPCVGGGLGSVTFPVLRNLAPGREEDVARTSRKMMSNGHLRPGLGSWCQARMYRLPGCVPGEALPPSLSAGPGGAGGGESACPHSGPSALEASPGPEWGGSLQTYQPASFPPAPHPHGERQAALVGQEGAVLWVAVVKVPPLCLAFWAPALGQALH